MSGKTTNLESKISGQDKTYKSLRTAIVNRYSGFGKINKDLKSLEKLREKQLRCRHRDIILAEVGNLTPEQVARVKEILTD